MCTDISERAASWLSQYFPQHMQTNPEKSYLVDVGHLGIQSAESFCALLQDYMKSTDDVVIDLANVETYDAVGLQLLYSCQKTAKEAGQHFTMINASPALGELAISLGLQEDLHGPQEQE